MDSMKGPGRALILFDGAGSYILELVAFKDASLSIRKNGKDVGIWEANEHAECFKEFARLASVAHAMDAVIVSLIVERALLNERPARIGPRKPGTSGESLN